MTLEKVHLSLLNIIVVKETFKTIIAVKKTFVGYTIITSKGHDNWESSPFLIDYHRIITPKGHDTRESSPFLIDYHRSQEDLQDYHRSQEDPCWLCIYNF